MPLDSAALRLIEQSADDVIALQTQARTTYACQGEQPTQGRPTPEMMIGTSLVIAS
ncbi:hypothetical protein [Mesorhizobium hawassense]|uniref:hypothetical protein n=1 Tax=Mesorhizobium hawassense TaxID=1209954 RepID=UPI00142D2BE4|nr:hypothetical protein [Mesorhizobium hawassense]